MNVGAVGGIRNIKDAISVSRRVMEKTRHSLLGGELAADFAVQMGFVKESLQTSKSAEMHRKWRENRCQPNFWEVLKTKKYSQIRKMYRQTVQFWTTLSIKDHIIKFK